MLAMVVAVLVPALAAGSGILLAPDGGYTNIVVKFDNDVSQRHCATYIQRLTEMFTEASGVLHTATAGLGGGGVYFKQVTVVVPAHWDQAYCAAKIGSPGRGLAYKTADIRVAAAPAVSPGAPYTQHAQGCGRQGEVITVPEVLLTDWNSTVARLGSPAKLLTKEWAKLRYGVFDEHGFRGDPLYPNHYRVQGKWAPTGTSDAAVRGTWVTADGAAECEDPSSGECVFSPSGENDQVSCSLGFLPQLPSVTHWCGREETLKLPTSPTKHNILCGGRTAAEVIAAHPDFAVERRGAGAADSLQLDLRPSVTLVREPRPRYVVMIETSAAMAASWKWVRKAVQNLVRHQLPPGASVAILTFNTAAQVESRLVTLASATDRARVADTVPDSANKLGDTAEACVSCAVATAAAQLFNGNTAGAELVVVTSGGWTGDSVDSVADSGAVRVSAVSVLRDSDSFHALAARTGGEYRAVSGGATDLALYTQLIGHLADIIAHQPGSAAAHAHPVTIHSQRVTSGAVASTFGSFTVASDLGRDTEFGIYVEDDEDHQIKSVTFSDSQSNIYGPFTSMSSLYDSVNLKTINFNVGETPPFDSPSKLGTAWSYSIDWYTAARARENVVVVRSRPRDPSKVVRVETWTSLDTASPASNVVTGTNLMAVFVQVTRGGSPVVEADLEVNITVRLENGSTARVDNITMVDNGYGEPDTVAQDGIYSGYVTRYPGPGRYSVSVRAGAGAGTSVVTAAGAGACCGSRVPVDTSASVGSFSREQRGVSVDISKVDLPGTDTDKLIQPGKIGDLAIAVSNTSQLVMTWTAPGGDYNDGSVVTYRLVYSHNIEELVRSGTPPALDGLKRTDAAGARVEHAVSFPYYNQDYYVGVAASDEHGNRGRMSNIVLVHIPGPDTGAQSTVSPSTGRGADTDWVVVGCVVGGVAFLLLTLLAVLCICRCCRGRHAGSRFSKDKFAKSLKSSGVKVEFPSPAQSETTDTSSYESEQQQQQQQQHGTMKPHSSTSFAANLTPTYWSASQLLGQHEMRQSAEPRPHPAQLQPPQEPQYRQSAADLYRQLDTGSQVYGAGGYYPDHYADAALHHSNYGYYGSEPADYHDYYPQQYPHHRHSSASVEPGVYGGYGEEQLVTRQPGHGDRELDLRNITQV